MPTEFQNLVTGYLNPAVDEHFGETFTLRPMRTPPNGKPAPDPDRTTVNAIGVLHQASQEAALEEGNRDRRGNDLRSILNIPGHDLLVDQGKLPQGARQGDEVEIRGETYYVASARFDDISRWELRLTK